MTLPNMNKYDREVRIRPYAACARALAEVGVEDVFVIGPGWARKPCTRSLAAHRAGHREDHDGVREGWRAVPCPDRMVAGARAATRRKVQRRR